MNYDNARVYDAMTAIRASVKLGFDLRLTAGEEIDLQNWLKARVREREEIEAAIKRSKAA